MANRWGESMGWGVERPVISTMVRYRLPHPRGDETTCPPAPSTLTLRFAASKLSISIMRQAEAIVAAIRSGQGDLATKSDIVGVHAEIAGVCAEIAGVRTEIGTLRWVVGIQSAITLATFAIVAAKLL